MSTGKPILYSYFRSSCSWRVRIALAWKNVDYEYKPINLLKGEQVSEEFTKLNPLQEVPVFVDDGNVITHSLPIIEYLEETYPSPPLLPAGRVLRAQVRAAAECIASGIQPLQNLRVLRLIGDEKDDWAYKCIVRGFTGLEKLLRPLHGKCCFHDSVTIADVFLVPQVYNARKFNVDMLQFPVLNSINDYLLGLDAFKNSHPCVQPDCPDELRKH